MHRCQWHGATGYEEFRGGWPRSRRTGCIGSTASSRCKIMTRVRAARPTNRSFLPSEVLLLGRQKMDGSSLRSGISSPQELNTTKQLAIKHGQGKERSECASWGEAGCLVLLIAPDPRCAVLNCLRSIHTYRKLRSSPLTKSKKLASFPLTSNGRPRVGFPNT
jgi:hypothetical protein